jgi:hypothetical protein
MDTGEIKWLEACPKCGVTTHIYRKVELEDKRNLYLEVHACCFKCSFIYREFYEKGVMVKWVDMTPKPAQNPDPIKVVKTCPFCGKYCDSKSGQPYFFAQYRIRHYSCQNCINEIQRRFGMEGLIRVPTPFGPPYENK